MHNQDSTLEKTEVFDLLKSHIQNEFKEGSFDIAIQDLNELIKSEKVQCFTETQYIAYNNDIRKCYENDEITRQEWQDLLRESQDLVKSVVTNLSGEKINIYLKLL